MSWYLQGRFPDAAAAMALLAFASPGTAQAAALEGLGFRILHGGGGSGSGSGSGLPGSGLATAVHREARMGRDAVAVLASASSDTSVIDEAEASGAQAYVWSPEPRGPLATRAALGRFVYWHEPYLVQWYMELVAGLSGRRTSRARWAQACRGLAGTNALLRPESLGLRRRGGYWGLLMRLEEMGFVTLTTDRTNPNFFTAVAREGLAPPPKRPAVQTAARDD